MRTVLICATDALAQDLEHTLLSRADLESHPATSCPEALARALTDRPHLVMVDRDLPDADLLVDGLRREPATRAVSIVVVARGAIDPREARLLEVGANAVFRLPAGAEWDQKLGRLLAVPPRRDTRLGVEIALASGPRARGKILNLSRMGMLVTVSAELQLGIEVEFSFTLGSPPPVHGKGRVVRTAGPNTWGIEFVSLEGLGAARVALFVSARGAPRR